MVVHILERDSLEVMYVTGRRAAAKPGLFYGTHSIVSDSKKNVYTTRNLRR